MKKIQQVTIFAAALFLFSEIYLRAVNYSNLVQLYRSHKELLYEMSPRKNIFVEGCFHDGRAFSVTTNTLGFRGQETPVRKERDELRVMFFGDSNTFGWQVEAQDTYAERLRAYLSAALPGKKVSVMNCGVPGYTSYQGLGSAKKVIPEFKPDIAFFSFGRNDMDYALSTDAQQSQMLPRWRVFIWNSLIESRLAAYIIKRCFIAKAHLCRFSVTQFLFSRQSRRETQKGKVHKTRRVLRKEFIANLDAMASLCRRHNTVAVFVPIPFQTPPDKDREHYDPLYLHVMRTVQAMPAVSLAVSHPGTFFSSDGVHPSAHGHDAIARSLVKWIMERKRELRLSQ